MTDLKPKIMTVKEVAKALGVSVELITKRIREIFPEKMKKGVVTYLNEYEVTAISVRIKENSTLLSTSYDRMKIEKTGLEKKLLIKQGYDLLMSEVSELERQLNVAKDVIEIMKPKVQIADKCIKDESEHYSITQSGKHLGLRQSEIFSILREKKLIDFENLPTQKALDQEILQIRSQNVNGRNRQQAIMTFHNLERFNAKYLDSKSLIIY